VKEKMGWRLIPMNMPPVFMHRDSPLFFKAGFSDYDVWVTPFKDREIYPGGFYLNNGGLPTIVKREPSASIENQDIVLWHVFGLTHIPRAEDFPIMPVEEAGFTLRPHNFFLQNPSLNLGTTQDMPPARN
jgi:primary-amine oxidase